MKFEQTKHFKSNKGEFCVMSQELLFIPITQNYRIVSVNAAGESKIENLNQLPVQIVSNKLRVNENIMKEGIIYPVKYQNETYHVTRNNGTTTVFQIEE